MRILFSNAVKFYSINRTFMELKFIKQQLILRLVKVLIEPSWNWNIVYPISDLKKMFVLIEPSWNWNNAVDWTAARCHYSINRTFMELKSKLQYWLFVYFTVLIEPSWNWNCLVFYMWYFLCVVLIEPSWNWNHTNKHADSRSRKY